jgi:hypothetical protein
MIPTHLHVMNHLPCCGPRVVLSATQASCDAGTMQGVGHLLSLPALRFLDIRGTPALQHGVLHKLARRFSLQVPGLSPLQLLAARLCGATSPAGGMLLKQQLGVRHCWMQGQCHSDDRGTASS